MILVHSKEIVQTLIALYVLKKGATVKANWLVKVSSFTILVGVILGCFHNYVQYADWGILAWGIALTYAAAGAYLLDVIRQVKLIERGEMKATSAESAKENDIKAVEKRRSGATGGIFSEDGDVMAETQLENLNSSENAAETERTE